jgi:hypothetical protein
METNTPEAKSKVVFDLASIDVVKDSNTGASIDLYHPTSGADLGIKIHIIGRDSDKFRETQAAQGRKRLAKMKKTGFQTNGLQADTESDGIELLAHCTTGWEGMVMGGKAVPFSFDNAVAIYTSHPWIKEQVDAAIADRSLFTKA